MKLVDSSFVRRDFYVSPPEKDASPEEWHKWLKKDAAKARGHKAAYTRSLSHMDIPEEFHSNETRKINGRWVQCLGIGVNGSVDNDTLHGDVMVEANHEYAAVAIRMRRVENKRGVRNVEQNRARRKKRKKKSRQKKHGKII